jgi:hypothetical protein
MLPRATATSSYASRFVSPKPTTTDHTDDTDQNPSSAASGKYVVENAWSEQEAGKAGEEVSVGVIRRCTRRWFSISPNFPTFCSKHLRAGHSEESSMWPRLQPRRIHARVGF